MCSRPTKPRVSLLANTGNSFFFFFFNTGNSVPPFIIEPGRSWTFLSMSEAFAHYRGRVILGIEESSPEIMNRGHN